MEKWPNLPSLLKRKIIPPIQPKRAQRNLRMQLVQTPIYHYNQNAHAQYQVAPVEMVAGYVLDSQLQQGHFVCFFGKLIGISQKSAWKLGHAIRKMMEPGSELVPALSGIVELDEKYIGGKPRYEKGVVHKRGKGTAKQ
jgi:hypothetical protein